MASGGTIVHNTKNCLSPKHPPSPNHPPKQPPPLPLQVYEAISRHVDWTIVKCLVIAGPGFTKEDFRTFLDAEAVRRDERPLVLNKSKIVLAPASSAFKHSLKEVLALPSVASQIKV